MKQFEWDSFIKDCFQQNYVLLVGNEVMLEKTVCNGNSYLYLRKEFEKKISNYFDFREFLYSENIPTDLCNKQLVKLLSTKLFRVVITTTTDNLLERIMKSIWGDELQVIDFCDKEKRHTFQIDSYGEFDLTKPTLYYAFGKSDNEDFAYDEDDRLRIISEWLDHNEVPQSFYGYIQQKKILALGCKFDDWLFRFFWYSLRRKVINTEKRYSRDFKTHKMGTVAIELDKDNKYDLQLKRYLERKNLYFDIDAHSFISDFLGKLSFEENGIYKYNDMETVCDCKECFISYAHEDFDVAYHLFLALKNRNFNVWMDTEKMLPGSEYEKRIKNAITECKVFIPILSNTTSGDFNKGLFDETDYDKKRYYLREWELASTSVEKKVIIPFLCKGYNINDPSYKHVPWYKAGNDRTYQEIESPIAKLIDGIRENGYDIKTNKQ